ncbi:S8 family peptidase [Streptomyces yaizuensis]|uniref:S8 family peptidase n=1 Tax=Streptomyces yaizuensis TaxID=2989713 RepID=A0ABQ5PBJ2_9ACTN|nr:S8 family serine peptidase [Streptomyces sp. YSPA8]GLF99591.1 S8 family peptidase [Streptomyces sp. YSPA8]
MRKPVKKAYAATVAAAAAVALTAGMTSPVSAQGGGRDTVSPAGAKTAGTGGRAVHTVVLITGDRVLVDSKGRVAGIERAKGREDIPFFTQVHEGRTYVMPRDARRLIGDGTLDQRLFDITGLAEPESRKAYRGGLKVIVGYRGATAGAARTEVRASDGTTVRRTLSSLDADAVTSATGSTDALWDALTRQRRDGSAATTSGIAKIWLDGVQKASLDRSTGRIGAPAAWGRSLDGTGVKIAVLDTGIDDTHPDLAGRVTAARNFTRSPDALDRVGHGTHVAATAAGTGAKDSRFKGVAPGAQLINAKVLDDGGYGSDSESIAGIDWAVAQGADIINMSLGSPDRPGIDPLEAHVNKVSAEKGVLFAVAAGNLPMPRPGTVNSPGTAAAALTVGAVDDNDQLASFSALGPRKEDHAVKPDISAPGVAITAAAASGTPGQDPAGYVSLDGTSMATPHVAGAAAILKQKNPTWTGAQLKAALTGSAAAGTHSVFEQGAGRLAVDRAIDQTVFSEGGPVHLGRQLWPHNDDTPTTKQVTYRNSGTADVTLDLSLPAPTGSDGQPAPAGFFTLGAQRITVPAGGTASVDLTADTRLGGAVDGAYSVTVVASGGGQTVRTPATVDREVESYDVTFDTVGRADAPAASWGADLRGYQGLADGLHFLPDLSSGSATVRLPRGTYNLQADMQADPANPQKGLDLIHNPRFSVTGPTTVTLDARTTRPVSVKVPDAAARQTRGGMFYTIGTPDAGFAHGFDVKSFENIRTARHGSRGADASLTQQWSARWERGTSVYQTLAGGAVQELATGYDKVYAAKDLALVKVGFGATAPGMAGGLTAEGSLPEAGGFVDNYPAQPAPGTQKLYVSTGDGVDWYFYASVLGEANPDGGRPIDVQYGLGLDPRLTPGTTYSKNVNVGVVGPRMEANEGLVRQGDDLYGAFPMVSDGAGHQGFARYSAATTTVHRNGVLYAQKDGAVDRESFTLPAESAEYTVATTVHRNPKYNRTGTRIDASWTFTSAHSGTAPAALPVSTVRFQPRLALDSSAPAGVKQTFPVVVQGAAAGTNLKTLRVEVSYDKQNWLPAPVSAGRITVRAPEKGKTVSLKAVVTDKQGNESTVTIHDAFSGR